MPPPFFPIDQLSFKKYLIDENFYDFKAKSTKKTHIQLLIDIGLYIFCVQVIDLEYWNEHIMRAPYCKMWAFCQSYIIFKHPYDRWLHVFLSCYVSLSQPNARQCPGMWKLIKSKQENTWKQEIYKCITKGSFIKC